MRTAVPESRVSQPTPIPTVTSNRPIDLTNAHDEEFQENLGRIVTVRGKFSLYGVVGPFVLVGNRSIYLPPEGSYSWGKEYDRLEGRQVRVTGTLNFRHFEPSPGQHPPDYFYLPWKTAKIELLK